MGFLDFLSSTKKPAAGVAPASPEKVKQALLAVNRPTAPALPRRGRIPAIA